MKWTSVSIWMDQAVSWKTSFSPSLLVVSSLHHSHHPLALCMWMYSQKRERERTSMCKFSHIHKLPGSVVIVVLGSTQTQRYHNSSGWDAICILSSPSESTKGQCWLACAPTLLHRLKLIKSVRDTHPVCVLYITGLMDHNGIGHVRLIFTTH